MNDHTPEFSAPVYEVTVPENVSGKKLVKLVAMDADAGSFDHVTYTLLNTTLSKLPLR
jgi:hypothetical protein